MKKAIFFLICFGSVNAYAGSFDSIPNVRPGHEVLAEGMSNFFNNMAARRAQEQQLQIARMQAQREMQLQEQEAEINQLRMEMMREQLKQIHRANRSNKKRGTHKLRQST